MKRRRTLGITLILVLATAWQLKAQTGLSDYTSYFLSKDVPYDFTDAVNYKGNVYILQTILPMQRDTPFTCATSRGIPTRTKTFYYQGLPEKGLILEGEALRVFAWDVTISCPTGKQLL